MDTHIQQQVQHWQRIELKPDMNLLILENGLKSVNLLLGSLDENFEWDASKNLHRQPRNYPWDPFMQ